MYETEKYYRIKVISKFDQRLRTTVPWYYVLAAVGERKAGGGGQRRTKDLPSPWEACSLFIFLCSYLFLESVQLSVAACVDNNKVGSYNFEPVEMGFLAPMLVLPGRCILQCLRILRLGMRLKVPLLPEMTGQQHGNTT